MENTVSPAKSGIQLGVLFGVIMIFEFVVMYIIGMENLIETSVGLITNLLNYLVLPFLFIYLGCNNYKVKFNNGFISFSQCLKIGVSIMFLAGLIYAIFNVIFSVIYPDYINEVMAISKKAMLKKDPNMTSEQLEMGITMMKKFMNPFIALPVTIAMYSFFGLIYSLIIGAIVKKDNPQSF